MNSWRNTILKNFAPKVAKLTLVADPDCLLTEEKLAMALRQSGFDIIEFNDPIEFRYVYESKYRSIWDRGEHIDLIVILRQQDSKLADLPFDLLQVGRKLSFSLGDLFPNMSYPIIEQLDRSLLDALFDAQEKTSTDRMGDNPTKDFILRHVFKVSTELISKDVDLLRFLLRLHYGNLTVPTKLTERLVEVLDNGGKFKDWSLSQIIPDAEQFFAFIQERWPIFLEHLGHSNQVKVATSIDYGLKIEGPVTLPFEHQDIRVYIDNLFVEGKLTPVDGPKIEKKSWISSGIKSSNSDDKYLRISRLFQLIDTAELSKESRHTEWISFAQRWAELSALIHTKKSHADHKQRYEEAGQKWNDLFADWLAVHYASLMSISTTNPAMLHHVARHMARSIEAPKNNKLAMLVIDGLSLDQWVTVRSILQKQNGNLVLRESATFAWIPTITSVSRQTLFSGALPYSFPSSINSTNSEEKLWKQFWQDQGISKLDTVYKRTLGDGDALNDMEGLIHPTQTKVVGLVVDTVDKIMHGMQLGAAGMHSQIDQWCELGYLSSLLDYLNNHGFEIWITSDHGNIESIGKGRLSEGAIASSRGKRVRIYPTKELRSQFSTNAAFAREWQSSGLPENYYPLVATGNGAFESEGNSCISHGGVAIEEVIVPLIKVEKRVQ